MYSLYKLTFAGWRHMSIFLIFDFFFVSKVIKERLRTNFCCKFLFRDVITKKTAVLLHFVQIASPLPLNLDNLYNFFERQKDSRKCIYEKAPKNLRRSPPHLIWTKSERREVFFVITSVIPDIAFICSLMNLSLLGLILAKFQF